MITADDVDQLAQDRQRDEIDKWDCRFRTGEGQDATLKCPNKKGFYKKEITYSGIGRVTLHSSDRSWCSNSAPADQP